MPIEHVFLDMDGVLTDFTSAALHAHGKAELLTDWPKGERDLAKVLGVSRGDFWRVVDALGREFWSSLAPYPWFEELVAIVRSVAPFTVLTSPAMLPGCSEGKAAWLHKHFPKIKGRTFRDYLIGDQKHLLAQPNRLLIDDSESYVEAFQNAGGQAILFPQVWNSNHAIADPIAYVRTELAKAR